MLQSWFYVWTKKVKKKLLFLKLEAFSCFQQKKIYEAYSIKLRNLWNVKFFIEYKSVKKYLFSYEKMCFAFLLIKSQSHFQKNLEVILFSITAILYLFL